MDVAANRLFRLKIVPLVVPLMERAGTVPASVRTAGLDVIAAITCPQVPALVMMKWRRSNARKRVQPMELARREHVDVILAGMAFHATCKACVQKNA